VGKYVGFGLLFVVLLLVALSITTIPAGQRGVVTQFGATTGTVLDEGLQFHLPIIQSVQKMSVQTQKYEVDAATASKDLQDVFTTIAINWRLQPDKCDDIYKNIGLEYIDRIAAPAVQEKMKKVTAKYNAEDLILQREAVNTEFKTMLAEDLIEFGIIVDKVNIVSFQFSSTFTAAIEAKVAAQQAVFEAQNKLERVKVEAEQRKAQAMGEADARIAEAEGQAQAIRIVTAAQVSANESIASSLSPEVLQYILLDRVGEDVKVMIVPSGQSIVVPTE